MSTKPVTLQEAFTKIKTLLRAASARSHAALQAAIATALDAVTTDTAGWFTHPGHTTPHTTGSAPSLVDS